MNYTEMRMVLIEWEDTSLLDVGLIDIKELKKIIKNDEMVDIKAFIIGFLIDETKDHLYVAKEIWEVGSCKYLHKVPKRSVIKMVDLTIKGEVI